MPRMTEYERQSWFPMLVQYADEEEPTLVQDTLDIRSGVDFRVVETRYPGFN